MLSLMQIKKAVNQAIKTALANTAFSNIEIVANDVLEGEVIKRPSIKVMLANSLNGLFNCNNREKTLTFRVYFFAEDIKKHSIDNLKMQDVIETALLEGLYIDEAYIPIESVQSETVDTVLVCSFDLYVIELLPDTDTAEIIEELKFREVNND